MSTKNLEIMVVVFLVDDETFGSNNDNDEDHDSNDGDNDSDDSM